jgi:hypothetical protein
VDEAEEEEDARSYASARSGSSYSYSSSDSSSGGEDRIGAAAKETVPQQPAARSTEKTSGGTTADAAPHGACDEVKSEADTLSALRAQVVSAIERNDGADFQAALAANPKQVHTEAAASGAAEATSPTMVASPSPHSAQEDLSPTSPAAAETAPPPERQTPQEERPPMARPVGFIRVFADGSFDLVTPENPDVPVPLQQTDMNRCLTIVKSVAYELARDDVPRVESTAGPTPADSSGEAQPPMESTAAATPVVSSGEGTTEPQVECIAATESAAAATGATNAETPNPADDSAQASQALAADTAGDAPATAASAPMEDAAGNAEANSAVRGMSTAANAAASELQSGSARGRSRKRRKRQRHKRPKSPRA